MEVFIMDIMELEVIATFTAGYVNLFVVAFCLAVGVILKHGIARLPNNVIPCILSVVGIIIAGWQAHAFNPEIIFTGIASAITSCGIHSATKNTWITLKEFVENVVLKYKKE